MTAKASRYVVTPGVAITLASWNAQIADGVQLLAPTLIRSQVLAQLYRQVRAGRSSLAEAEEALGYIRGLGMRLLGDRVLQDVAWKMAGDLDLPDTLEAEYIALTKLQADALVTDDPDLRRAASKLISVAPMDQLVHHGNATTL